MAKLNPNLTWHEVFQHINVVYQTKLKPWITSHHETQSSYHHQIPHESTILYQIFPPTHLLFIITLGFGFGTLSSCLLPAIVVRQHINTDIIPPDCNPIIYHFMLITIGWYLILRLIAYQLHHRTQLAHAFMIFLTVLYVIPSTIWSVYQHQDTVIVTTSYHHDNPHDENDDGQEILVTATGQRYQINSDRFIYNTDPRLKKPILHRLYQQPLYLTYAN